MTLEEIKGACYKLSVKDSIELLYTCIDNLDLMSVQDTAQALAITRGRVYQRINDSNSIDLLGHKAILINEFNK